MKELVLKPALYRFETCGEFAREFKLGKEDLILTNRYIFEPKFGGLNTGAQTVFQEEFGAGEPTDRMADDILRAAEKAGAKRIVAIGGGTVIDLAKVLAVADGGDVDALYENMEGLTKNRELVIVPTTCGTGSEVTNIAILNRTRIGTKMGLVSDCMYADSAVLIPELLDGLPYGVFATSSIDALVHAVESGLSPKATPYTRLFGDRAIEMILGGYRVIAEKGPGSRRELLGDFLTASNYAGIAFGTAGCAAVHAMSYPLGGKYHVAHGESNYAVFTGVLKNYMELKSDGAIAELNLLIAGVLGCGTGAVYGELEKLLGRILPKKALREYGVTEQDLTDFTRSVMTTQGRLMANSFVPLDEARVLKIYRELY